MKAHGQQNENFTSSKGGNGSRKNLALGRKLLSEKIQAVPPMSETLLEW